MREKLIVAGFGGQGILLAGIVLANAGMDQGKHVSWLPSYGPEMRGGTANCHVILSDHMIGSPIIEIPDSLIVMNGPSLDKFEKILKPGGILIINSSLVARETIRKDARAVCIPASDLAISLGNTRIANIIILGAYIKATGVVEMSYAEEAIKSVIGTKKAELTELNIQALRTGAEYTGGTNGN